MLKGQDVVILLALLEGGPPASERSLAAALDYNQPEVHRALGRLDAAGLYDKRRNRVPRAQAEEFLLHAVKFLQPAVRGGETRGVATSWAAEPLASEIAPTSELPPVWPDPAGDVRGLSLEPLHAIVPRLGKRDPKLRELLVLVDGLRDGDARLRRIAGALLRKRLRELERR